jgi:hypothetical protein
MIVDLAQRQSAACGAGPEKAGSAGRRRYPWRSLRETAVDFRNADNSERSHITCVSNDTTGLYHRQFIGADAGRRPSHSKTPEKPELLSSLVPTFVLAFCTRKNPTSLGVWLFHSRLNTIGPPPATGRSCKLQPQA